MPERKSESEILRMLKAGEKGAATVIFNQYSERLYRIINRIVNNPETAKDLLQDIFYRLWRNREKLNILSIEPYLVRAAVNEALTHLRDHPEKFQSIDPDTAQFVVNTGKDCQQIEYRELEELINKAIASMPPQRKAIFTLSRFEKMSYRQIALHLGISEKSVEKHISKALESLRIALKPYLKLILLMITI